jgi:hypothetical protein
MVVIKGKEAKLKKRVPTSIVRLNEESKRKLRRPQDNQPISTVAV